MKTVLHGKPCAGNPHARFEEGASASKTPRQNALLHKEYSPHYTNEDLLDPWSFTDGVAKYVELLMDAGAHTRDAMIDFMVREDSVFVDEGHAVLVDEFGREFGTYFSILSAIAVGRASRNEISQTIGRDVGGYLTRLENYYSVIAKRQPMFSAASVKGVQFCLVDNFFIFWFHYYPVYGIVVIKRDKSRIDLEVVKKKYEAFVKASGNWKRA